ncbi:MAG TPA: HD domain-containing protein [Acidimicrobiales bacterium]|jgi:predicted HD phosphohydrolase|nr:HD domain-containing protein [Acidimicrobiales bacterium]
MTALEHQIVDRASDRPGERASFTRMDESTAEDWALITGADPEWRQTFVNHLLDQLRILGTGTGGFAVDRLTHSLQTAHRAELDGRDDAYVVCALLHDIGDTLGPQNHAEVAAVVLRPWVSEAHHWMVAQHGVFQGYYFWHHLGGDRNARDQFTGHPHYDLTEEFVRLYDMPAFDPAYATPPLEHFEPLLSSFFASASVAG